MHEITIAFWVVIAIFAMLALEPARAQKQSRQSEAGEIQMFKPIFDGHSSTERLMKQSFPGGKVCLDEIEVTQTLNKKIVDRPAFSRLIATAQRR